MRRQKISSFQIIIIGFMTVIMLGTFLLMLPIATKNGEGASFLDALFTSTSSVCVTGLLAQDTATYWSLFGQIVIMVLIQIGGLGVITIAMTFFMLAGRKIGLMQRNTIQEAIAAPNVGGVLKLTGFIVRTALLIELVGAFLLATVFCKEFGGGKGIWYALFHSVSAFCNAGFDLMGVKQQYSSLTLYSAQPMVNIVIMLLIILGGIGFLTWEDVKSNKFHFKKYRMQTKVILSMTFFLILLPAIFFYFGEFFDMGEDVSTKEKVFLSLFQSVTTRTAGFNTADLTAFTDSGKAVLIILMLIGGASGSAAGGMKVTTVAVLFSSAIAVFKREEDAHFFGRRVPPQTVRYAATIMLMYVTLFLAGGLVISRVENLPLLTCLVETSSAIGTVGLTLGITPTLSAISKIILIALMYFGRVGGLTLIFAAISGNVSHVSKLPQERITVG